MLKNMIHQRNLVAMEAFISTDLAGLVRRVFPSIERDMGSFKGMFRTGPAVGLNGAQRDFLKSVEKKTFPSLMPLTAYVPEGLKSSYLEYSQVLFPTVLHAVQVDKLINDYTTFLSVMISNRTATFETLSHKKFYADLSAGRERLNKDILSCFNPQSTRTDVKVENVVGRNADWEAVLKTSEEMANLINKVDRTKLNTKVAECVELLERLGKQINDGHFDKVSPEVVLDLSDGAYQVASELEFYAATYYRVISLCEAINRTMQHVIKVGEPVAA
jgi:hypothetical protein